MTPEKIELLHNSHNCVAIFPDHISAEKAVKELQGAGVDMSKISIIGRDYHTDEQVVGFYNAGDRVKHWGKFGAFWGGIFGIIFAPAFFWIPGIGPILTGGIIGSAIMGTIEGGLVGAATVGGLNVLGASLFSIGIPKDSIIQYEKAITADKFVLIVHGTDEETEKARELFGNHSEEITINTPV